MPGDWITPSREVKVLTTSFPIVCSSEWLNVPHLDQTDRMNSSPRAERMPTPKRAAHLLVRRTTRIPISHSHSNDLAKAESLLPGRLPSRTGWQIAAVFADHTGIPAASSSYPPPIHALLSSPSVRAVCHGTANSCWPDCGAHHQVSVLSCLLALTLLVPSWLLAPPRECRQTSSAVLRLTAGVVHSKNRRLCC